MKNPDLKNDEYPVYWEYLKDDIKNDLISDGWTPTEEEMASKEPIGELHIENK